MEQKQKNSIFKLISTLSWTVGIVCAIYSVSYFIKGNLNEGVVSLISGLVYCFLGYSFVRYGLEKNKKTTRIICLAVSFIWIEKVLVAVSHGMPFLNASNLFDLVTAFLLILVTVKVTVKELTNKTTE